MPSVFRVRGTGGSLVGFLLTPQFRPTVAPWGQGGRGLPTSNGRQTGLPDQPSTMKPVMIRLILVDRFVQVSTIWRRQPDSQHQRTTNRKGHFIMAPHHPGGSITFRFCPLLKPLLATVDPEVGRCGYPCHLRRVKCMHSVHQQRSPSVHGGEIDRGSCTQIPIFKVNISML